MTASIIDPAAAQQLIRTLTPTAIQKANELTRQTFRTRGGRIGSGMGLLLEALWGYCINVALDESNSGLEIGWIATHEYNDFACMIKDVDWDAASKAGEVLRVELKSMVAAADEPKGHFDKTIQELGEHDLLVVLMWDWEVLDDRRFYPRINDAVVSVARQVAELRDALHIARGGSFVQHGQCLDGCDPQPCSHLGEPLNAAGKRERLTGPKAAMPRSVAYAANFGGLIRMLKTSGPNAKNVFRQVRSRCAGADAYIDFVHRNRPQEELNHYSVLEWRTFAKEHQIETERMPAAILQREVSERVPNYRQKMKERFPPTY